MEQNLQKHLDVQMKKRRLKRTWKRIVSVLGSIVVFCTTYALILPAITMSETSYCGIEEHKHDEACYSSNLICEHENESIEPHEHSDQCYALEKMLKCELEEMEGHVHNEQCKELKDILVCELEETEEHSHNEECWIEEENIVCELEETEGHAHTEECWEEITNLICELPLTMEVSEEETHVHEDTCYEKAFICEVDEHTHSLACFSNPEADVEAAADWEQTIPKELTGIWHEDILLVAESQLGYEESIKNYIVTEEEALKGYTRYGDWYGDSYGHWCAMFVSFCLNYAEIPEMEMPYDSNCQNWLEELQALERYEEADTYEPLPGDLVFFSFGKTRSDHVGLVKEVTEDGQLRTIEGNSVNNKVEYRTYDLNDENIIGYGKLPENTKTGQIVKITAEEDWATATATFEEGVLPQETILKISLIEEEVSELEGSLQEVISENSQELLRSHFLAVEFLDKEGNVVEPTGEVLIQLNFASPVEPSLMQTYAMRREVSNDEISDSDWSFYSIDDTSKTPVLENEDETLIKTNSENALESVAFTYQPNATYALAAVNTRAATIDSFSALKTAINGTSSTVEIQLGADIPFGETITISKGKNVVIDLANHTIDASSRTAFIVENGSLTITDSSNVVSNSETITDGKYYGNIATYDVSEKQLVYYVTTATPVGESRVGETAESLIKHTVTLAGRIKGGNNPIIEVKSKGTFTLNGGSLVEGKNRAIISVDGTVNLNGGYICGNSCSEDGGAVYSDNGAGVVNVSGDVVIAANSTGNRGGGIKVDEGKLNISGGVISGNRSTWSGKSEEWEGHRGGGGIFTWNATITMTGGYITNNKSDAVGYFDGGGGVLITGNTKFTLSNGYITGNEANGGGGIRTDWNNGVTLTMTGGYVCSNYARGAEGGGISVNMGANAHITGGYINDNASNTSEHWGGGGLFCSNGSNLYITKALVTNNTAQGFGGGVAGCSTGRVYLCVNQGGAVYDNAAKGLNLSGDTSAKNEDHLYAQANEVFMQNGYEDFFCALNSMVEGEMLGGQAANWSGSADGYPVVSTGVNDTLSATYIMGLTANPSEEAKAAAEARNVASLYINGNESNTHGGGVLANGYLIVGIPKDITVATRLELSGTKAYYNALGEVLEMQGGEFKFNLIDANTNAVMATAVNDKDGNITFMERIPFSQEGTFVYYLQEEVLEDKTITWDSTVYRIKVTVGYTYTQDYLQEIDKHEYKITKIEVDKKNEGDWETVTTKNPNVSEDSAVKLQVTNGPTFRNFKYDKTQVTVVKEWNDSLNHTNDSVVVGLFRDGVLQGEKVTLSRANNWRYTWTGLDIYSPENELYEYTVQEDPVPGYQTKYEVHNTSQVAGYWVPASSLELGKRYLIVSSDGTQALKITDGHKNDYLTSEDKTPVTRNNEKITIANVKYDNYYLATKAMDKIAFTAQSAKTKDDVRGTILLNTELSSAILIEPKDGKVLKGGTGLGSGYVSLFEYSQNCLNGLKEWAKDPNAKYTMIYDDTKFTAVSGITTDKAVKIYTYVEGAATGNEIIYTVTNTPTNELNYNLEITKQSGSDSNIKLSGASFELRKMNSAGELEALSFVKQSEGAYVYVSSSNVLDSTISLKTAARGKLMLSGLPAGEYILHETQAPIGYKLAEDTTVILGDSTSTTVSLTIVDEREGEYILPETGGIGTNVFTISGVAMMAASLLMGCYMTRKRERRIQ